MLRVGDGIERVGEGTDDGCTGIDVGDLFTFGIDVELDGLKTAGGGVAGEEGAWHKGEGDGGRVRILNFLLAGLMRSRLAPFV